MKKGRLVSALSTAVILSGCAAFEPAPPRVDPMATLGVSVTGASSTGAIRALRGKPIALHVGPNIRADAEHSTKFKESIGASKIMLDIFGGKDMLDAATDPNRTILPFATMLKSHFPDIRVARTLDEAAQVVPGALVIVDMHVQGDKVSKFWAQIDFMVPSSSRTVHRTIQSIVERACPGTVEGAEKSHRCFREAEDAMFADLKTKLDAAMR